MRIARVVASLAPALLAVAACLPARDNPSDPDKSPAARVRVLDMSLATGGCAPIDAPGLFPPVLVDASRGACLVLDASETTNPSGGPLSALTFQFSVLGSDGQLIFERANETPGTAFARAAIGAARQTLPIDTELSVHLRVVSPSGYISEASRSFTLRNGRPSAIGDPLLVLPPGGDPTAPGADFMLSFDGGRSTDPDGDALTYCWSFDTDPTRYCRTAQDPPIVHAFTSSFGEHVGRLHVSDGMFESTEARTAVVIRKSDVWAFDYGGYATLDPYRDVDTTFAAPGERPIFVDRGAQSLFLTVEGNMLHRKRWTDLAPLPDVGASPNVAYDSFDDPLHARVWVKHPGGISWWTVDASGISAENGPFPVPDFPYDALLDFDVAGNAWGYTPNLNEARPVLDVLSPTGVLTTAVLFAGRRPSGVGVRPVEKPGDVEEIWTWQIAESDPAADGVLARYGDASSAPEMMVHSHDFDGAGILAWIDREQFWTVTPLRGLLRVDAATLERTHDLDLSTVEAFDVDGETFSTSDRFAIDRRTGAIWLAAENGVRTFYATPWGTFAARNAQAFASFRPVAPDLAGVEHWMSVYSGPVGTLVIGLQALSGSSTTGLELSIPFAANGSPAAARDLARGGFWVASQRPSLVRVWADGTVDEFETLASGVAVPHLNGLFVAADGTRVWGIDGDDIWTFDVTTRPIAGARIASNLAFASGRAFSVEQPRALTAWFATSGGTSLSRIAIDGSRPAGIPGAIAGSDAALAPGAAGGACAVSSSSGSLVMRFVSPNGAVSTLGSVSQSPFESLEIAASSSAAGEDFCWATRSDNNASASLVTEWSVSTQTVIHTWQEFHANSLVPIGRDEFWATNDLNGTVVSTPNHVRMDPAQTSVISGTLPVSVQSHRLVP